MLRSVSTGTGYQRCATAPLAPTAACRREAGAAFPPGFCFTARLAVPARVHIDG
jgi:hypothetical protein